MSPRRSKWQPEPHDSGGASPFSDEQTFLRNALAEMGQDATLMITRALEHPDTLPEVIQEIRNLSARFCELLQSCLNMSNGESSALCKKQARKMLRSLDNAQDRMEGQSGLGELAETVETMRMLIHDTVTRR